VRKQALKTAIIKKDRTDRRIWGERQRALRAEYRVDTVLGHLHRSNSRVDAVIGDLRQSEELRKNEDARMAEERLRANGGSHTQTSSTNTQQFTNECKLCYNAECDAVFPCGHAYSCMACAFSIQVAEGKSFASCPVCRAEGPFRRLHFG
jgi:hypothetical protein